MTLFTLAIVLCFAWVALCVLAFIALNLWDDTFDIDKTYSNTYKRVLNRRNLYAAE
jgi:uncharacterized protein YdeI (YjbR/CyaY-like superfamily)